MEIRKQYAMLLPLLILAVTIVTAAASRAVTLISEVMTPPGTPRTTVVIDPGHGGEDGGAVSCTGVRESLLNLAVGRRLEDLTLFLGMRTRMTRRSDVSVCDADAETVSEKKVSDLKNRVRMVNGTEDPILISIHQNMFQDAKYAGAQVFYAGTEGSQTLAELLQRNLRESLDPENRREIKKSLTVYLLNKVQCPAVLVECGFLSNPKEEALLRTEDYQKKLVCALAAGLSQYLTTRAGPA